MRRRIECRPDQNQDRHSPRLKSALRCSEAGSTKAATTSNRAARREEGSDSLGIIGGESRDAEASADHREGDSLLQVWPRPASPEPLSAAEISSRGWGNQQVLGLHTCSPCAGYWLVSRAGHSMLPGWRNLWRLIAGMPRASASRRRCAFTTPFRLS